MNNISKEVHSVIQFATKSTKSMSQSYCLREHILLGLLQQDEVCKLLKSSGVSSIGALKKCVLDYLNEQEKTNRAESHEQILFSPGTEHLFQVAYSYVERSGRREINPFDLILSFFNVSDLNNCFALF